MISSNYFSAADWNIKLFTKLLEAIEIDIKERLFQPLVTKALKFATGFKCIFI